MAEVRVTETLVSCPDCGRDVSVRAATCPGCGAPGPTPRPTRVHDRTGAFLIAILTIPLVVGIVALLAMLWSPYRNGPCPHCGDRGSFREQKVMKHVTCGNLVVRQDQYLYPANDRAAEWDGSVAKRRASD